MDLQLAQLRTLREISRLGSMTSAARRLGYTVGAVSQQMAALERSAGVALFERAGRRVRITDAGGVLVLHADRLLRAERQARQALEELNTSIVAEVRVGVFATAAAPLLAPVLSRLRHEHPKLVVRCLDIDVDDATAAVSRGELDLAFGLDYDDAPIPRSTDVDLISLRTERFGVASAKSPRRPTAPVSLSSLAHAEWILPPARSHYGLAVRMACRKAGFEPRAAHEVNDTATTLAMVEAGLGVALATELMQRLRPQGVAVSPLIEPMERRIVLVRQQPNSRPSTAVVIDAVRDILNKQR